MLARAVVTSLALAAAMATDVAAQTEREIRPLPVQADKIAHGPGCSESYLNTGVPVGIYYPAGAGVEVLDDLHLGVVYVTGLCAFDFGYFKEGPGTTDATVTFYANNADDDVPGAMLATFPLPGLPSGQNGFHIEVPSASLVQEVWLGVSFSTDDAGLELAHCDWPGVSHDYFYMRPPAGYFTFGGNPKANYLLGVYATGALVAVGGDSGVEMSGFRENPFPNPSRGTVDFRFSIREAGRVRADVLDVLGRVVAVIAEGPFDPGTYMLSWDGRTTRGSRAAAGVYLVRLTMPRFAGTRKLVLVR